MADEVSGVACDRVATGVRVVMVEDGSGRIIFAVYRGLVYYLEIILSIGSGSLEMDLAGRKKKPKSITSVVVWWKWKGYAVLGRRFVLDMHVLNAVPVADR